MIDIQDVRVYDPKKDGLDLATYERVLLATNGINETAGKMM